MVSILAYLPVGSGLPFVLAIILSRSTSIISLNEFAQAACKNVPAHNAETSCQLVPPQA